MDIEYEYLDKISKVSRLLGFSSNTNMNQIGDWGILYLVCGCIAGQLPRVQFTVIESLPKNNEVVIDFLAGDNQKLVYQTQVFGRLINEWSKNTGAKILATKRIESMENRLSSQTRDLYIYYFTLAIVLNSLTDCSKIDELASVINWCDTHQRGWEVLFFYTGVYLSIDESLRWEKYGSVFKGVNLDKVNELFNYFGGLSSF